MYAGMPVIYFIVPILSNQLFYHGPSAIKILALQLTHFQKMLNSIKQILRSNLGSVIPSRFQALHDQLIGR